MQIGRLSAATGVPVRSIRFYEDRGILPPPERTAAGYREYDQRAVDRLRFVRSAQDAGLALAEIRSIVIIRDGGDAPCVHTRSLLEAKRDEVEDRMRRLGELRADLDRLIEAGKGIDPGTCHPDDICSILST